MAAIDRAASLDFNVDLTAGAAGIIDEIKSKVTAEFRRIAWSWFHAHKDDVIFTKKILFYSVKIKVSDCKFIFIELAGPEPV